MVICFKFHGWVMKFNATFNTISVISWWSVLLVEEKGVPRENDRPAARHWQTWTHNVVSSTGTDKLEHIMLYRVHLAWTGFEFTNVSGDLNFINSGTSSWGLIIVWRGQRHITIFIKYQLSYTGDTKTSHSVMINKLSVVCASFDKIENI